MQEASAIRFDDMNRQWPVVGMDGTGKDKTTNGSVAGDTGLRQGRESTSGSSSGDDGTTRSLGDNNGLRR